MSAAKAAISGLTIADGSAIRAGGGIFNQGDLTITGVTFTGNSANVNGGAINNVGTLAINDSTFVGNTVGQAGGGGLQLGSGHDRQLELPRQFRRFRAAAVSRRTMQLITIANTTIDDNTTGFYGGGISLNGARDPEPQVRHALAHQLDAQR